MSAVREKEPLGTQLPVRAPTNDSVESATSSWLASTLMSYLLAMALPTLIDKMYVTRLMVTAGETSAANVSPSVVGKRGA